MEMAIDRNSERIPQSRKLSKHKDHLWEVHDTLLDAEGQRQLLKVLQTGKFHHLVKNEKALKKNGEQ